MKRLLLLFICLFVYLFIGLLPSPPAHAVVANPRVSNGSFSQSWMIGDFPNCIKDSVQNSSNCASAFSGHVSVVAPLDMTTLLISGAVPGVTVPVNAYRDDPEYVQDINQHSAIAGVNNMMVAIYMNPPADLALWIKDTGQTLGFLPKQAAAQTPGIGFSGLNALLQIWKGFRNIAYGLVAIIMIIIGFLVMFRKKIDPKTVVTVQNALPRIIFTLILITFSYAIAGFMIDLMYVSIALGVTILSTTFGGVNVLGMQADFLNGGIFTLLGAVFAPIVNFNPLVQTLGPIGQGIASGDILKTLQTIGTGILQQAQNPGQAAGNAGALLGGVVLGPFVAALLSLAFLFAFIRILLMLLSAYVHILLGVMIGPLQILTEALPGGSGFSSWMKNLFINLVPFPITVFMLILGNGLINSASGPLWQPPLLPQTVAGIGGGAASLAQTIIWLGIILTIPSVVSGIKEALKTKPLIPVGAGAITSPLQESFQSLTGAASLFYYGASIRNMLPKQEKPRGG